MSAEKKDYSAEILIELLVYGIVAGAIGNHFNSASVGFLTLFFMLEMGSISRSLRHLRES